MAKKTKKPVNRPQNVMKHALSSPLFREKRTKSAEEKAEQKDPFSKKAKHKKPQNLEEFYQVGDKVEIVDGPLKKVLDRAEKIRKAKAEKNGVTPEDKKTPKKDVKAIVREPHGPAGTIGITLDGEYHLVDEEDVKLIFEAFGQEYEDLTEWSYAETMSGLRVPISSEEAEIYNKCGSPIYKTNMDDREQEVARRMVSRGVIHRHKDDDGIYFVRDTKKLTRF